MIRFSTIPVVWPPSRFRSRVSASRMAPVVVLVRSIVIAAAFLRSGSRSEPAPGAPGAGHQGVGAGRSIRAGRVLLWLTGRGPEFLDRVEDRPGQLDLLLPGEQRRGGRPPVEQQAPVRLRA